MTQEYAPHKVASGTVLQSGIPKRPPSAKAYAARGLMFRGVVIATYVMDDPAHPAASASLSPVAVYCDVLCYTNRSNQRWLYLPKALVLQDRGAMHGGRVWKPRAAKIDMSDPANTPPDWNKGTSLGTVDGEHVLVGFLDDNPNMPIILGGIPHPSADIGNDAKDAGHRKKLVLADGDPDFWKHKGAFYGIDKDGNFTVDTTEAYAADSYLPDGSEPLPVLNGTTGNYNVKLPMGSKLHVEINDTANVLEFTESGLSVMAGTDSFKLAAGSMLEGKIGGGATFKFELQDALAKLTLGDGAKHVAIFEALETFWNTVLTPLFNAFDNHVHPTGVGPSDVPSPKVALPAFPVTAKSTKLSIPDA